MFDVQHIVVYVMLVITVVAIAIPALLHRRKSGSS